MDRTKASDAFNAGSIPVGCIYITLALIMPFAESRMRLFRLLRKCCICRDTSFISREKLCMDDGTPVTARVERFPATLKRKVQI